MAALQQVAGVCRPTKEEAAEYVELTERATHLHAKVQDTCLQSPQFAERLVPGAVVMVESAQQPGPRLSVVLGLEAAIKVLYPTQHHIVICCRIHRMYR